MWPQSGDGAAGSPPAVYGVPGPRQTTTLPSPITHLADSGTARAVTDTPGTAAVACTGAQSPPSHSHVGRFTS